MAQWSGQTTSFQGGHFGKPFWMSPPQDSEHRHSKQTTRFTPNVPARPLTENNTRNLWRTIEKEKEDGALFEECTFCNRPQSHVLCCACGHMFMGRVRTKCKEHSSTIHLMDTESCPKCKTKQTLKELQ